MQKGQRTVNTNKKRKGRKGGEEEEEEENNEEKEEAAKEDLKASEGVSVTSTGSIVKD